MSNSETNYKLTVTSIELKAPQEFANDWTTTTIAIDNGYRFEQLAKTQSKIEANITRTMYHSQTIFRSFTSIPIPFFELKGKEADDIITIGRIVLKITFSGDESGKWFSLFGTSQHPHPHFPHTSLQSSSDTILDYNNFFPVNFSNFTMQGVNNNTIKWIIDFNKSFKITTKDNYMFLGLTYGGNSEAKITIDAYTEVIY